MVRLRITAIPLTTSTPVFVVLFHISDLAFKSAGCASAIVGGEAAENNLGYFVGPEPQITDERLKFGI